MHNLSQIHPVHSVLTRRAFRPSLAYLAISILPGLLSTPAFAATRVTSIVVSATVVAGCQVAPSVSEANNLVAMNCTLPVPYQLAVNDNSPLQSVSRPSVSSVAGLPAYATRGSESLPSDQATQIASDSDNGLAALASLAESQDAIQSANGSANGTDAGTVRVTIAY
jgi:hypothetical protein